MLSLLAMLPTETVDVTVDSAATVITDTVTALTPAADAAAQAAQAAVPMAESLSFWELCLKGGFIMLPLALLLIVSVYVFFERWLIIRRADRDDETFMKRIREFIQQGDPQAAQVLCNRTNSPYARLISKGISRIGRPMNDVLVTIENTGNIEVANLGRHLPWLATTAAGAPMLGFLGTVWGMVQAFYNLAKAGTSANIDVLAGGIYQALVTTVAGLIVGIVALFAYNYLVARINGVMNALEAKTMEFMDLLNEPA